WPDIEKGASHEENGRYRQEKDACRGHFSIIPPCPAIYRRSTRYALLQSDASSSGSASLLLRRHSHARDCHAFDDASACCHHRDASYRHQWPAAPDSHFHISLHRDR